MVYGFLPKAVGMVAHPGVPPQGDQRHGSAALQGGSKTSVLSTFGDQGYGIGNALEKGHRYGKRKSVRMIPCPISGKDAQAHVQYDRDAVTPDAE
jgi:hypothetical protein